MLTNNTSYATAAAVLMDADGRETLVVAVKATFSWDAERSLRLLADAPPVVTADVFEEPPPAASGLALANELTLPKPRVDVILRGDIVLPAAKEQIDCTLEIGRRLLKTLRVFGDRHWRPSAVSSVLPSSPRSFLRMPISWSRSFGGVDSDDPGTLERRNPVGRGVRKRTEALEGQPAPNFEDPHAPIKDPLKRPVPVGFGAMAPHWQPRSDFAGTYDEAWQQDRYPVLPADFDARFLNAAPLDQQLDDYQPGAEVHLHNFTPARQDRFVLPELAPLVTVVEGPGIVEVATRVDTVVIEPAAARVALVARAAFVPGDVQQLKSIYVGPLTPGQRRALQAGKTYLRLGG